MRRAFGICVVAVLMSSAIGVTAASALPEVGRCVAQAGTGKYKDSNCTQKAGAKVEEKQFEFIKGAEKTGFTEAGGEMVIETASASKYVCSGESATGKYDQDFNSEGKPLAITEVESVVMKLYNCGMPGLGLTCNTPGLAREIVTNPLKGDLGYIKNTIPKSVGQQLEPATTKTAFAEFECGGGAARIVVKGTTATNCIIAPVTPFNVMSTTAELKYSGSGGVQNPDHFETTPTKKCNLESNSNGGAFERMTWQLNTTLTNEEALDIRA
jgi:hypothetical protein